MRIKIDPNGQTQEVDGEINRRAASLRVHVGVGPEACGGSNIHQSTDRAAVDTAYPERFPVWHFDDNFVGFPRYQLRAQHAGESINGNSLYYALRHRVLWSIKERPVYRVGAWRCLKTVGR